MKRVHGRVELDEGDHVFDISFKRQDRERSGLTHAELATIRSAFDCVDRTMGERRELLILLLNGITPTERAYQLRKIRSAIPRSWTVKQRLLLRSAAIKLRTMMEEPTREQQARKRRLSKPWRKRVRGTYRRSKVSRS